MTTMADIFKFGTQSKANLDAGANIQGGANNHTGGEGQWRETGTKEGGTTNNITQGNTSTHPPTAGNRHNEELIREPLPPITATITTSNHQHNLFSFNYFLLVILTI